ncbi:hypothetical protein [Teredinibacter turnerae]|uniref:hypothetical protein n=1 Tax=Teredinibacter turnerae TaxID=2426 RepID=UPI00048EA077|nr:hypothetical protein [Teredinibacter turnerae]
MKWIVVPLIIISNMAWSSGQPPELWSWIKDLDKSKEACEIQSSFVLQAIKLENQKETKYGIYGNVKSNSVVVKCIEISMSKSKLMVAVAGNNRDSVEIIRNKIVGAIN